MDDINTIKERIKAKRRLKKEPPSITKPQKPLLYKITSKIMLLLVVFLTILIYTKANNENKLYVYNKLFNNHLSFVHFRQLYNQYLGGVLPFQDLFKEDRTVFKEELVYKEMNIYKDGVALTVEPNYLVPIKESGIIVFIGHKDGYENTVIIQQVDGVDLWYSNIDNINVKIYDYVESGTFLGETVDDKLYLVYKKEGKVLNYKDYLK